MPKIKEIDKETIKKAVMDNITFNEPIYIHHLVYKTLLSLNLIKSDKNKKLMREVIDELKKDNIIKDFNEDTSVNSYLE